MLCDAMGLEVGRLMAGIICAGSQLSKVAFVPLTSVNNVDSLEVQSCSMLYAHQTIDNRMRISKQPFLRAVFRSVTDEIRESYSL